MIAIPLGPDHDTVLHRWDDVVHRIIGELVGDATADGVTVDLVVAAVLALPRDLAIVSDLECQVGAASLNKIMFET